VKFNQNILKGRMGKKIFKKNSFLVFLAKRNLKIFFDKIDLKNLFPISFLKKMLLKRKGDLKSVFEKLEKVSRSRLWKR